MQLTDSVRRMSFTYFRLFASSASSMPNRRAPDCWTTLENKEKVYQHEFPHSTTACSNALDTLVQIPKVRLQRLQRRDELQPPNADDIPVPSTTHPNPKGKTQQTS